MQLDTLKYIMQLENERRELKEENNRLVEKWQSEVMATLNTLVPSSMTTVNLDLVRGQETIIIPEMTIEVPRRLSFKGMQEYISWVQAKVISTVCTDLFKEYKRLERSAI